MMEIAPTDRKLLAALRQDGRASVTNLAAQLKVSRATVQVGMERLVKSGAIQRFTVEIGAGADEELVRAVTTIELQGALAREVIRRLRKLPQIVSLHTTNGAWDLVASIEATSLADFDHVLRQIREIPGVLNSESNLLLAKA